MTFEEEFPSLKDNFDIEFGQCVNYGKGNLIHIGDVRKHCFDKQLVRKQLITHWKDINFGAPVDLNFKEIFKSLNLELPTEKELGLEE